MKLLVIRFNSIGDLVLVSPTVKVLAQEGHKIHFLVKDAFTDMMSLNPHIEKVLPFKSLDQDLINELRSFGFDAVIDLHNNLRSNWICNRLKLKRYSLDKQSVRDFVMIKFGLFRYERKHIVERFIDVVRPIVKGEINSDIEFYLKSIDNYKSIDLSGENYICIAVGTSFATKDIPQEKLKSFLSSYDGRVVLLGGMDDIDKAEYITSELVDRPIINFVGKLKIDESAFIIKNSTLVLTGDTGLMHIAAALSIPTVSIFGSTHPMLGFSPYYGKQSINHHIIQNISLTCRPCTGQGRNKCPRSHFKCMNDIPVDEIRRKVEDIAKL